MKKALFFISFSLMMIFYQLVWAEAINGIVAYYPFNGNTNDESGNNHHPSPTNLNNLTYANGIIDEGLFLDGIDDIILIPNHADFNNSNFTLSIWLKTTSDNSNYIEGSNHWAYVFAKGKSYDYQYGIIASGYFDKIMATSWQSAGGGIYSAEDSYATISDGNWHLIVGVITEDNSKLYIDGNLNATNTSAYPERTWNKNGNADLTIGGAVTMPGYFEGIVDEVRIFNRELNIDEITTLFDIGKNSSENKLFGKVITASEILGYTASVGGAVITALPYSISTTTDIYGEFSFINIPYGNCILEIESSYFEKITKTVNVKLGVNKIQNIQVYKPKCDNLYTQSEVDEMIYDIKTEKEIIIEEKEETIRQLNASISSMYTQEYLDQAIIEAEKRGELKYDINNDGKVGLEEVIKYLETLSGVRVESLIIFPNE